MDNTNYTLIKGYENVNINNNNKVQDGLSRIREDVDVLEGALIQLAVDNTDGSYSEIKKFLKDVSEEEYDNNDELTVLYILSENALDTLEWQIRDIKPFK